MAYCFKHNYEYEFLSSCRHCTLENELNEQTRVSERLAKEQIEAQREASQAQIEAIEEASRRREELHYEMLAEQQQIAEDLAYEQQRIAEETIAAQRYNIANSWRLEAQAKVDQAMEMFNAEMFEESLDLAQQAIGEKGSGGDVGNILGHFVAGASMLVLGKPDEAEKYFASQLKLLSTSDYYDNAQIHKTVFEALPKNEEYLQKFSSLTLNNAVKWNLSHDFLGLIEHFNNQNLTAEAKNLAQICVSKLENCFIPLQHWGVIHKLSTIGLREEVSLAARMTIKNTPKMLDDKNEFMHLITVLRGLIIDGIFPEAKLLAETISRHSNLISFEAYRQEILHRTNQPFDNNLIHFLQNIPPHKRNSIIPELEAIFAADDISPTTAAFIKGQVGNRYQQWTSSIEDEIKGKTLAKVGYESKIPIGLMIGAFVSGLLCFPIGFIVNGVWGFKIFQKYQKLKEFDIDASVSLDSEVGKWRSILNHNVQLIKPTLELNKVELIAFVISLSLNLLIFLSFFLPAILQAKRK